MASRDPRSGSRRLHAPVEGSVFFVCENTSILNSVSDTVAYENAPAGESALSSFPRVLFGGTFRAHRERGKMGNSSQKLEEKKKEKKETGRELRKCSLWTARPISEGTCIPTCPALRETRSFGVFFFIREEWETGVRERQACLVLPCLEVDRAVPITELWGPSDVIRTNGY